MLSSRLWPLFYILLLAAVCSCSATAPTATPAPAYDEATGAHRSRPLAAASRSSTEATATATASAHDLMPRAPATPTAIATATSPPSATPTSTPMATASATRGATWHTVAPGESLWGIADQYGLTLQSVLRENDLDATHVLVVSETLRIPPAVGANIAPPRATRDYGYEIIGFSANSHPIEVFSFGDGNDDVVFVGGIHGGYEWNTVLLAYEIIDYFNGNRGVIPPGVTVHVIPVANPDGLRVVVGTSGRFTRNMVGAAPRASRFNGNGVDLNRNWSCNWSAVARWGGTTVNPGPEPFSEPETRALRGFFLRLQPRAVIFWHSQATLVAPGRCGGPSAALAETYAAASGYPHRPFTEYELNGTASDWLDGQGIPSIAVELATHTYTEYWSNLYGVLAVLEGE